MQDSVQNRAPPWYVVEDAQISRPKMTDKHSPSTRRALACILTAALVANAPRGGHAAPAKDGPVRTPAAEAVALFEEGTVLEREGDKQAAADRYRAAAEANWALHDAVDPASAAHATFVTRAIKSYDAAFNLSDRPALYQSASDWCTKLLAGKAEKSISVKIREKCAQWGWPPPVPNEPRATDDPHVPDVPHAPVVVLEEESVAPGELKKTNSVAKNLRPPPPPSPPLSSSKSWKGLAIVGGSTLASGTILLLLALAGAARQYSIKKYTDTCTKPYSDLCTQLMSNGEALIPLTVASVITGSVLTGTGAALLTVAMRRRAAKITAAPALHSQFIGLTLRGRF